MTTSLDRAEIDALLPLALGHDQDASACPWVGLTRRTTDYPSRKAQAALAIARGAVLASPDLVDLLYRCDGCGRCRAASPLAEPPDLARALWPVRAALVAGGAVSEVAPLAETYRAHGSVYGDLTSARAHLGPGDPEADALLVPGAATLRHAPEAAAAALRAARLIGGRVAVDDDLLDSAQELLELGLAEEAAGARLALRRRVAAAGHRTIMAGTPKEAFGLREALAGLPVAVDYVGAAFAAAVTGGRLALPTTDAGEAVVFHPSESLLHRLDGFEVVDRWLASWLRERYRRESDPHHEAWPAAIERPAVRVPAELTRLLAARRLAQLLTLLGSADRAVVLTCDPWSWRALRAVAPPEIEVVDLLVFATRHGQGTPSVPEGGRPR